MSTEVKSQSSSLDRNSFFLGLAISVAIVVILYYLYNRFAKDATASLFPTKHSQPAPPLLEKSPFVRDVENDEEAASVMSSSGTPKVLLVHAPWCGHCRNMMGAFLQAASRESTVEWLRADGNSTPSLVNRPDLRGFPTIYGINARGEITQHNGPRDAATLVKFAKTLSEDRSQAPVFVPSKDVHEEAVKIEEVDDENEKEGTEGVEELTE